MDLELFNLLKQLGGSAPGMETWQPTGTDLSGASQQNARPWVGVKPALAQEGTAPRTLPRSYAQPRVFEMEGTNLRQVGGPLMGLMAVLLPALLGHNPWQDAADMEGTRRSETIRGQLGPQPESYWRMLDQGI